MYCGSLRGRWYKPYQEKDFQDGRPVSGAEKLSAAAELTEELRKPEIVAGFEQLRRLLQDPIQDYGKQAILRAAREYRFTLAELGSAFRTAGQGFKRAGGLIKFATEIFPPVSAGRPGDYTRPHTRQRAGS